MHKKTIFNVGLFFDISVLILLVPLYSRASSLIGLNDAFFAAQQRSEDLASQTELIAQAEERLTQAKGAFLPNLVGSGTYLVQPSPGAASNFSPPTQTTAKLTLTQPLFQGLKEFALWRQQKQKLESSQWLEHQARIQLFQDLVKSYYGVLAFEKDIKNLGDEIQVNEKRLSELNTFKKLGRSRETDVLTEQAQIASLEAQLKQLEGKYRDARAVFEFMTGLDSQVSLADQQVLQKSFGSLGEYLARIDLRPDIRALKSAVEQAEENVTIARSGHLPTLNAVGDYFFQRPGFLSEVNWDAQVMLTFPIFQGGIVQSQVRQAASMRKQNELALSKARRLAQQQITSYYSIYEADLLQIQKQQLSTELAKKNYQAELRDYRFGLVTNIEVLQVLTTWQEGQRLLDKNLYQAKIDYLYLQAAAAFVPEILPNKKGS